ncbi:hypothetical protein [Sporolactobacillus shoreae]|uniref:hypothetical protein n=1 Tax=Sporolactobacillus shoreae TaxID=1465501 RepID=UPI001433035F|nr:hypothetical protein [Sporolactobacillus shoreae]
MDADWRQKEDIYVTQGAALYGIQQDVDGQNQTASISKTSKFTPIVNIQVPSK